MSKSSIPILEAASITRYYGSLHALNDVNLIVDKQEIYGIIGLSGAGKSTLLRCLAGLIYPSSGKIFFQGWDTSLWKKKELRRFRLSIGMIFQHFHLLNSRTVAENIAYPLEIANVAKKERERRVDELLHLVGLFEKKHVYPASLSGGEKQRVGIARALANQPEILFCDEATSALDPKTTKEILDLLNTINKKLGVTIVLITHDMEVIKRICHKVTVLEKGKVIEQGLVSEVFASPKHPTTRHLIQGVSHDIPEELFQPASDHRKLLRLHFTGKAAEDPLISQIIKQYQVDANILLGWIDRLQTTTVGTLIIELTGEPESISQALSYLEKHAVKCEVLQKHVP